MRIACALVATLVALAPFADAAGTAASAASVPIAGTPAPRSRIDALVMAQPDVKAWAKAVFAADRQVVVHHDRVRGQPHCTDVTLHEDAGPYWTRYGTWRVCGADVRRLRDD